VSIQELAAFVGRTTATKRAVQVAALFRRHLQVLINRVVPLASPTEEVLPSSCKDICVSHVKVGVVDAGDAESLWSSFTDGHT